jgi:hypothetical protein
VVGRSRNCSEPFARLRDPGGSSHSVAQLLCGLDDRLSLCRESYVLARISSKCRCAKRECEDDAYVSDRPAAQATWSSYCFHALIVMRLRISRKLIRHLRAQCFARDSFNLKKRSQLLIRMYNEALSIALCGHNPNFSPLAFSNSNVRCRRVSNGRDLHARLDKRCVSRTPKRIGKSNFRLSDTVYLFMLR